jgi:hypothetical protein
VQPVDDGAHGWLFQINKAAEQQEAGGQDNDADAEEGVADHHGAADFAVLRVPHMDDAEDKEGRDDQQAQYDVDKKHPLVEVVLKSPFGPELEECDSGQVQTVGGDHGQQGENAEKDNSETRADGFFHLASFGPRFGGDSRHDGTFR